MNLEYPWEDIFGSGVKSRNFLIWLGLADYKIEWTSANIFVDFVLLLLVSCQVITGYNFIVISEKFRQLYSASRIRHFQLVIMNRFIVMVFTSSKTILIMTLLPLKG